MYYSADMLMHWRTDAMQRFTCHYSGNVQGVGFRYTVMNISQSYDVLGFVRNLPDGQVELVMEGDLHECEQMIEEVKQRMADYISDADVQKSVATDEFSRFDLRY